MSGTAVLENASTATPLTIEDWGRIAYRDAWRRQKELVERRIADEIPDTLIFCEHDPVITLGRASQRDGEVVVPRDGVEILEIERGGFATYHGPGQVVAYPIFKLGRSANEGGERPPESRRGVLALIRSLEGWVCHYLRDLGLEAGTVPGKTGVWVKNERKLSSIGIAARHWVSYHGVSLNLDTGREAWSWLNPCGLGSEVMSDVRSENGKKVAYSEAVRHLSELARIHF